MRHEGFYKALNSYKRTLQFIYTAQKDLKALKEGLHAYLIQSDDAELLNFAYWNLDISFLKDAAKLRQLSISEYKSKFITSLQVNCKICSFEFTLTSKSARCPKCQRKEAEQWRERDKEYDQRRLREEKERQGRVDRLNALSYKDYLKTPEWQEIRQDHIKYAKYSCQLCNANGNIHVHHRHYNSPRGEECWRDLIVLCENCHKKIHTKLPQPSSARAEIISIKR